jgi:hypothetical protein
VSRVVRYVPPDAAVTQPLPVVEREEAEARRPRNRAWLLAPFLAVLIPVAAGLAWAQRDDDGGARQTRQTGAVLAVEPVPHAADAQAQARELSTWLRTHAR